MKNYNMPRGEKHHSATLTEAKVRAMRKLHEERGIGATCLGKLYGVSQNTAWDAINYNTWRHVR